MIELQMAAHYKSFYEVAKKIKNPESRLAFYDALDAYRFDGIEPEGLPFEADIAFTAIKPNVDADRQRKEDGAKGGMAKAAKKRATRLENSFYPPSENNSTPLENNFYPPTNNFCSKDNVNDNVNVNETENANANSSDCARIDRLSPESFKDFQEDLYETIQKHNETAPNERKMPVSDSFLTFTMLEARDLLATPGMKESPPDKVKAALDNFLLTARSDTWQTAFTWRTFCNHWLEYAPDYFAMRPHLNAAPNTDDATKRPENAFYINHKDDPDFKGDLFRKHAAEWLAGGRPEGAFYLDLQKKWEEEDAG